MFGNLLNSAGSKFATLPCQLKRHHLCVVTCLSCRFSVHHQRLLVGQQQHPEQPAHPSPHLHCPEATRQADCIQETKTRGVGYQQHLNWAWVRGWVLPRVSKILWSACLQYLLPLIRAFVNYCHGSDDFMSVPFFSVLLVKRAISKRRKIKAPAEFCLWWNKFNFPCVLRHNHRHRIQQVDSEVGKLSSAALQVTNAKSETQ